MRRALAAAALAAAAAAASACGPPAGTPVPPGGPGPGIPAPGAPGGPPKPGAPGAPLEPQRTYDVTTVPPFEYLAHGSGPALAKGNLVEIHYVGSLPDGTVFDSSRKRDEPFTFELGAGHVIPGWELVIAKLQIGDHITTTIPPDLAYGDRGMHGQVPARSAVKYDIEVLRVIPPPTWEVVQTGTGDVVKYGQTVTGHYVGTLPDGKVFLDSRKLKDPFRFKAGLGEVVEGWDFVIQKMRVGDRWKVHLPWVYAYGADGKPGLIPRKTDVDLDIELLGVCDRPKLTFRLPRGQGAMPASDSRVTVRFTGTLPDGSVFDSSKERGEPFRFRVGSAVVVEGWNDFFPYLHVGDKVEAHVPWVLGYGLLGHGLEEGSKPPKVPPKTDLVYDIEVLRVE